MFIVNRKSLLAELALLQSVAEVKTTIPVLAYVKFDFDGERLVLTATNIDVSVITEIQAQGEPWAGCLPSAQLYALVKLLTDEAITFTLKDGSMQIKAGRAKHKLPVMPVDQFPTIEVPSDSEDVGLSLPLMTRMIEATAFSALPLVDHLKPADIKFTGVSIRAVGGHLEIAASQKVVTGVAESEIDAPDFSVLIPQQAATTIRRMDGETVTVRYSENLAQFTAGPRSVIARQLMGQFPHWRQFIPEFPWTVTMDSRELQSAIRRATITMGVDNAVGYEPMKATFERESVLIETRGGDKGKSDEVVGTQSNMNGDALSIGFINGQVLSVLGQCGESVTCHLAAWDKPMMFTPVVEGMELTFIVMPVRVGW